jgi:DNA-binding NtrC family response regulator
MLSYRWPGNVRELQNTIERAVILTEPNRPVSSAALGLPSGQAASGESLLTAAPFDFEQPDVPMATATPAANREVIVRPIAEMEKQTIKAALQQTGGNRTKAADLLGISIRTLRNKLQEYRAEGDPDLVGAGTEDE